MPIDPAAGHINQVIFNANDPFLISLLELWLLANKASTVTEERIKSIEQGQDMLDAVKNRMFLERRARVDVLDLIPPKLLKEALERRGLDVHLSVTPVNVGLAPEPIQIEAIPQS